MRISSRARTLLFGTVADLMYALFTAVPYVGHFNPLLAQARELQRRGWRVAVAAHREMAGHVSAEAPEVPVVDLGSLGPVVERLRRCAQAASAEASYPRTALRFMPAVGQLWPSMFDALTEALIRDRPDMMIIDVFTLAGFSAADANGIPFVVNNPSVLSSIPLQLLPPAPDVPFVTSGRSIHRMRWRDRAAEPLWRRTALLFLWLTLDRKLHALHRSRGLRRIDVPALLEGRLFLVNGVFGLEYPRPLPSNVAMVGAMLPADVPPLSPAMARWLEDGPPVVYVNLGTVAEASAAQLAKMAEAFAAGSERVLWVLRDRLRDRLPAALSPQIRVVDWVASPRAVLAHPNVRVFVSHCGVNSVYESVAAGTPVVGIPVFSDQRDMAVRVADAGVGLWVDKSRFSATELGDAIARVSSDPRFRTRIAPIQKALAAAGGIGRAADLIETQARLAYDLEEPSSPGSARSCRA